MLWSEHDNFFYFYFVFMLFFYHHFLLQPVNLENNIQCLLCSLKSKVRSKFYIHLLGNIIFLLYIECKRYKIIVLKYLLVLHCFPHGLFTQYKENPSMYNYIKYLQLSISMWHNCRSIGKYCRFIGHDAVIVNLKLEKNIFLL